jgi:hypothetical protein
VVSFRYHLVSIAAVFLALGLGLLLGSIVLRPYVEHGLQAASRREQSQIAALYKQRDLLQEQIGRSQLVIQAAERQMVAGLLAGQRVVVVSAPGSPGGVISALSQLLTEAGATVSGQVQLQQSFFQRGPGTGHSLAQLANSLAPAAGVTLRRGSAVAQAGQVLASALLTRDGPGQPVAGQADAASSAVLRGFTAAGFLSPPNGNPGARATLALVIIPAVPPTAYDSDHASNALVTLARQLEAAGRGAVVAGALGGSGTGSAIDIMRTQAAAPRVSTVDNADYAAGQVVAVQALYEQLRGVSGSYGWQPSADHAGPSPAPTPSASLSGSTPPPLTTPHSRHVTASPSPGTS